MINFRYPILVTLALVATVGFAQTKSPGIRIRTETPIHGDTYLAIEAAISEFKAHIKNPQLRKYEIVVLDLGPNVGVIFQNLNKPLDVKGSIGPLPEYEVELDGNNFNVLSSNFVR